jgi:transposase
MDRTLRKTVEAARNKASGLARTYSSVAKAMSDASGKTVTARDVEKRMYENGLSLLDRRDGKRGGGRPSEIWTPEAVALLTSKEVNGLSFSQMAALLSRRLEGEYTRNAVAGKLHQMKLGAKRAAAMAARRDADIEERADTGATIARHCKP